MKKSLLMIFNIFLILVFSLFGYYLFINGKEYLLLKGQYNNIVVLNNKIIDVEKTHDELFHEIDVAKETYDNRKNELQILLQTNVDLTNRLKNLDNNIITTEKSISLMKEKISKLK